MSSATRYPRVLIIAANPISKVQAVGLMMGSFFAGWPRDRLAQIYFPLLHDFPPDPDVCTRYLRVNALGMTREENATEVSDAPAEHVGVVGGTVHKLTDKQSLRAAFIDPLRETLTRYPWLDRKLIDYARRFRPDVVYTLLGTIGIARIAAKIGRELGIPVVPQFTDNWIDTRFKGAPFGNHLRRRLLYWVDAVMERAPVVLAVSGTLQEEYARRFGKECHFLTFLVDENEYAAPFPAHERGNRPIRLVYAGNLQLQRWRTLRLVGEGLAALRAEGLNGSLEVYGSPQNRKAYAEALEIPGIVSFRPWVPASRLPRLLVGADVLVHAESADPAVLEFTRHSFSTKLSQYLMAARCTLLIGPKEAGAMREIARIGGGLIVEPEPKAVVDTLRRVLADATYRQEMGRQAGAVGRRHFEAHQNRERFRRILADAADGSYA